jgi:hypothetical protein
MVVAADVIARDTRVGAPTVMVVEADSEPEVTVIVVLPCPALVARPAEPALLLMTATEANAELHVTDPVMF